MARRSTARVVSAHRQLAEQRRAPDARRAVPAVAGQERHRVDHHEALDALGLALGEGEADGAPVVHDAAAPARRSTRSRKRSMKRVVLGDRVVEARRACRSARSRAGRARCRRCARRNASQSSELVGTPCRYSAGAAPSPAGAAPAPEDRQPVDLAGVLARRSGTGRGYRRGRARRGYRAACASRRARPPEPPAAGVRAVSATACARSTASRVMRPARAPDRRAGADGALAVAPTTATATSPTCACASACRRGSRCATRRWRRSRRRSARAASRRSSRARIQAILRAITDDPRDPGARAVARLAARTRRSRDARDYLTALPGVGRKTAACVLLFALRPARRPGRHARLPRRHAPRRCCARGRRSRSCTTRCSRSRPPGRGARAARQPAAPRPAHLPRARPRVRRVRAGADVPEPGFAVMSRGVRRGCVEWAS